MRRGSSGRQSIVGSSLIGQGLMTTLLSRVSSWTATFPPMVIAPSFARSAPATNPTLTPLVRECDASDTIIVPINPIERPGTPRTARDILNRLNEISFNSPAIKELRMIALLQQAADPGSGEGAVWASMRIHLVRNEIMAELGYSSKLNAEWDFLAMLRDKGREAAQEFLTKHGEDLGKRSTMDLSKLLEGV